MDTINLATIGDALSNSERTVEEPPKGPLPPGTRLLERYLIGWLLGQGNMGEVYRAQDLKLGEQVALKFLSSSSPEGPAPRDVDLLLREARLQRRVSHPNVCRVFDVGEVAGRPFISMEYIDGEDLASLLRRIGRLPPDKALHAAHQLCAGLHAAHEKGILHRDLKPANVMLDGDGHVRITDFGLAVQKADMAKSVSHAGTPIYMAPEQLKGGQVSVRSDLYALGLVLYELFTGRNAFRPTTVGELKRMHKELPPSPATIVKDLDPQIERAILWCLEPDPLRRPGSAAELARALPGGNSLSAAIQAGQTPSPQLVAAAGERRALPAPRAVALGVTLCLSLGLAMWLGQKASLLPRLPLQKPAVVLADKAEEIVAALGYPAVKHRAFGFDMYSAYLEEIERGDTSRTRWDRLARARPAAVDFWYRGWSRPLVSGRPDGQVDLHEPPPVQPGMISLRLDPLGHLRELAVVSATPANAPGSAAAPVLAAAPSAPVASAGPSAPAAPAAPDWDVLFRAAGLDRAAFQPAEPTRVPPVFGDQRAAWVGAYPEDGRERVRVEAAALLGRPVAFRVTEDAWPASAPGSIRPWRTAGADFLRGLTKACALVGAVVLAWRNLRYRRGDRAGALRVALWTMGLSALGFALRADHVADLGAEVVLLQRGLSDCLLQALGLWLFYIALEPYVRRLWPETLISWARLLEGQWRDPLVWRSILVGALTGCLGALLFFTNRLLPGWLGGPPVRPWLQDPAGVDALSGGMAAAGHFFSGLVEAATYSLTWLMVLVLCRLPLRRRWQAALLCGAFMWSRMMLSEFAGPLSPLLYAGMVLVCIGGMVRFGLLAFLVGKVVFSLLTTFPLFLELERSFARLTVLGTGALLALFLVGSIAAAGGFIDEPET